MQSVSTQGPLPRYIVLELTRRCNNRCLYCYNVWGGPDLYDEGKKDEMDLDEIKNFVLRLQAELPIETIALTGGEPVLRDDLPDILSFLSARKITPVLITNGTLLTEDRVRDTAGMTGMYQITLLSHRREIHDLLAGRPGAWDETVQGMLNVKRAGCNCSAVFVATKVNWQDLYKTAELALVLGAKILMYNRINLGCHNIHRAYELLPTAGMIQENLMSLEQIGEKYGMQSSVSVVIEPCVVSLGVYRHVHLGWCPLGGDMSYFTVDPRGNIRICNHSPVILGNIKTESIRDIYLNHPYVRNFRTTLPDECMSCKPGMRNVCRGGCRAAAEQCYGTINRVDPFVHLARQY